MNLRQLYFFVLEKKSGKIIHDAIESLNNNYGRLVNKINTNAKLHTLFDDQFYIKKKSKAIKLKLCCLEYTSHSVTVEFLPRTEMN